MIELIDRWVALYSVRTSFVESSVKRRRWDPVVSFRQTYSFLSYGISNHGICRGCLCIKVIGMFYLLWRGCVRLSWSPSCGLFYSFVGFLVSKYACVSWNPMVLKCSTPISWVGSTLWRLLRSDVALMIVLGGRVLPSLPFWSPTDRLDWVPSRITWHPLSGWIAFTPPSRIILAPSLKVQLKANFYKHITSFFITK